MNFVTRMLVGVTAMGVAGMASAASISVNLAKGGQTINVSGGPYGVEPSSVWTNGAPGFSNLLDDSNAPTTMDVATNISESNMGFYGPTYVGTPFNSGPDAYLSLESVAIQEIPYAQYKIIA